MTWYLNVVVSVANHFESLTTISADLFVVAKRKKGREIERDLDEPMLLILVMTLLVLIVVHLYSSETLLFCESPPLLNF